MRMTFSCVLCLLLVAACWAETTSHKDLPGRLLQQAISHVNSLIKTEKDNDISVHSPTNDIKDCCSQSALKCFTDGLMSTSQKNQALMKLNRNLRKSYIINSVNTCSEEEIQKAKCMSCDSYPKVSSKQFLNNLQSYLQKAFSRLP